MSDPSSGELLNVSNHDRRSAELRYVYPVVSRRAGGVSVGINLNPNNACNWRCLYCQVPDLVRGAAPELDLPLLEQELRGFLDALLHGDFMLKRVPEEVRRINDIALSGNGEPTSAVEFLQVVRIIARVRAEFSLADSIKTVLITNGSLLHRETVQQGAREMAAIGGELWFKFDRASEAGMMRVNDTKVRMSSVRANLLSAIAACPTWLQTCWFALDGTPPSRVDEDDYLSFVQSVPGLQGVLLYGIARSSMQPEASRLSTLSPSALEAFALRIRATGLQVKVSP